MQSAIPMPHLAGARPAAARALVLVVRGTQVGLAILGAFAWLA